MTMWGVEFARPDFLWLLLLIPLLVASHFFFLKRTQTKALRFANFQAIKRISGQRFVTKNITILVLRLLTFTVLITSLSGMTVWYDGLQNDFDYVIAMDTSSSMVNSDIEPTRLGAAKEASITMLDNVESSAAFGLVTFSGVTYARHQLSSNTLPMRLEITSLNISRTSGTDISSAIVTATNMFRDNDRGKAIVLFTDGVDTVGAYIDDNVERAVDYARKNNVIIYPVGIGTENAPVGYLPESFNLTTSIDKTGLDQVANETGGKAIYPKTSDELQQYFSDFDTRSSESRIPIELERYGLMAVAILLFIEWILINLAFRRVV
ncbi:MAG: vWA domain-containing protein [Candidatus Woesearchaeota archaeon]